MSLVSLLQEVWHHSDSVERSFQASETLLNNVSQVMCGQYDRMMAMVALEQTDDESVTTDTLSSSSEHNMTLPSSSSSLLMTATSSMDRTEINFRLRLQEQLLKAKHEFSSAIRSMQKKLNVHQLERSQHRFNINLLMQEVCVDVC